MKKQAGKGSAILVKGHLLIVCKVCNAGLEGVAGLAHLRARSMAGDRAASAYLNNKIKKTFNRLFRSTDQEIPPTILV